MWFRPIDGDSDSVAAVCRRELTAFPSTARMDVLNPALPVGTAHAIRERFSCLPVMLLSSAPATVLLATFVTHRHAPAPDRQRVYSRTRATSLLGGWGECLDPPPPSFRERGGCCDPGAADDPGAIRGRSGLRHDCGTALAQGALSLHVANGQRITIPLPVRSLRLVERWVRSVERRLV